MVEFQDGAQAAKHIVDSCQQIAALFEEDSTDVRVTLIVRSRSKDEMESNSLRCLVVSNDEHVEAAVALLEFSQHAKRQAEHE